MCVVMNGLIWRIYVGLRYKSVMNNNPMKIRDPTSVVPIKIQYPTSTLPAISPYYSGPNSDVPLYTMYLFIKKLFLTFKVFVESKIILIFVLNVAYIIYYYNLSKCLNF
jgi:hypothetical protein